MNAKHKTPRPAQAGFTLVEIMVVIVILGLLATMVATNVMGMSDEAKIETTRTNVHTIAGQVKMFYIKNGKLPDTLEDLLSEDVKGGPYLESLEPDAWDNEYILRGDTSKDFEVMSAGPDGIEDTEDDISSRRKRE